MSVADLPHYGLVPKDLSYNLEYRDRIYDRALEDVEFQHVLWQACSEDILYWLNVFGWIFEPRTGEKLPFLTYAFQDDLVYGVWEHMGKGDIGIVKSRCMGVSWCIVAIIHWFWQFHTRFTATWASYKEALVDRVGNPDSLFWKTDFVRNSQPLWMQPPMSMSDRQLLHIGNPGMNSVIDGTSTTRDITRGGRRMVVAFDEYGQYSASDGDAVEAASFAVTNTRIFLGTPTGAVGSFYEQITKVRASSSTFLKMEIPWMRHPDYARGLYRSDLEGRLEILDESFDFPRDYPFIVDTKTRSPWYDATEERFSNKMLMAQEVGMNWLGASGQYFDPEEVHANSDRCTSPSWHTGELRFDTEDFKPIEFKHVPEGNLQLWIHPDAAGRIPMSRRFVVGVDISGGTGASNSVAFVADADTKEHVATFCTSSLNPVSFAEACVALCRWFNNAYMVPEYNGPGATFVARCFTIGYDDMYFRKHEDKVGRETTNRPGWFATPNTKSKVLSEMHRAMTAEEFLVHDEYVFKEMSRYCYGSDGSPVHPSSLNLSDPSGAKHNHGDRATACALTWEGIRDIETSPDKKKEVVVPPNSFQARRLAYEKKLQNERGDGGGWRCSYCERTSR